MTTSHTGAGEADAPESVTDPDASADGTLEYSSPRTTQPTISNSPAGRVDWATIGVRLLALFCFTAAAAGVPIVVNVFLSDHDAPFRYVALMLAPYGIYAGAGILLWVLAVNIGQRMTADVPEPDRDPGQPPGVPAATGQAIAFSVIGLWTIVMAVREVPNIFRIGGASNTPYPPDIGGTIDRQALVRFLLEAVLGICLFLGGRGLSAFWNRITGRRDSGA